MQDTDGSRILYDAKTKTVRLVAADGGSYQEWTAQDLEAMKAMVKSAEAAGQSAQLSEELPKAQAEMEKALAGLPPEQQEMVRKQMHAAGAHSPGMGAMGGGETAEKSYEPMNQTKQVAGFATRGFRMFEGGEATGEVWTASPAQLGLTDADLTAVVGLASFIEEMTRDLPMETDTLDPRFFNPKAKGFLGLPVLVIDGKGTDQEERMELVKVTKGAVDPKVLQVPATAKKRTMGVSQGMR